MTVSRTARIIISVLVFIPVVAMMIVIAGFTSEDAERSAETSKGFVKDTLTVVYPDFNKLDKPEQDALVVRYDPPVRKIAHFTEYTCLGFLLMHAACVVSAAWTAEDRKLKLFPWKYAAIPAAAVGFAYGVFDELRQASVDGRACEGRDMLIDCAGVVVGIAIMIAIRAAVLHFRKRRSKN